MGMGATDESVEKLSARLLEGWTMLSETCPLPKCSVPLMRNRNNTEISCVQCETHFTHDFKPLGRESGPTTDVEGSAEAEAEVERKEHSIDGERQMSSKAPVDKIPRNLESKFASQSPQQVSASPKKGRNDNCKGLAEKLLQGWTLTDQYCPNCLTPLVRNREKKLLCVSCDKWVIPENELHASCCDSPTNLDAGREQQNRRQEKAPALSPSVVPTKTAKNTVGASNAEEICNRAINVLLSKMDLCVTKMEGVQAVPGEEATRMVEFLNSASKTILAVNDVKDTL